MNGTATLFNADAAAYTGTVEVLGVIFRAEDDGYAVLEVQDAGSGEGFALVGPVAHLGVGDRAEVAATGRRTTATGASCARRARCRSIPPTARARSPT